MFQSAIPVLRISNSSAAEESRRPSWASSSSSLSGPNKPTHVTRALSETASQSLTDSRADDPSRWINPCRQGRIQDSDNLPTTAKFDSADLELGDLSPLRSCDTPPPAHNFAGQLRLQIATQKLHYHQQSAPLRRSPPSAEEGNRLTATFGAEEKGIVGRNACFRHLSDARPAQRLLEQLVILLPASK